MDDSLGSLFGHDHSQDQTFENFFYPIAQSFDVVQAAAGFQLPTPLDDPSADPTFFYNGIGQSYVAAADNASYRQQGYLGRFGPNSSGTTGTASSHSRHCTSPLESSWSPNTPTSPAGGRGFATGYFVGATGIQPCTASASVSPVIMTTGVETWQNTFPKANQACLEPRPNHPAQLREVRQSCDMNAAVCHGGIDEIVPAKAEQGAWHHAMSEGLEEKTRYQPPPEGLAGGNPVDGSVEREGSLDSPETPGRRRSSAGRESLGQTPPPVGPSLRTATRRNRRAESHKLGESTEAQRARTNHNQVEKEYRNRLHHHFEKLLEVLPEGEVGADEDAVMKPAGSQQKRLSKVEVLDKACRHILHMEDDKARLKRRNSELRLALEKATRESNQQRPTPRMAH